VGLTLPAGTELLGYQAVVFGAPEAVVGEGPPVRETDDAEAAARLLLEAFDVPADVVETDASPLAAAASRAAGSFHVAEVDGRPVAAAILTICDGVGYLAMAGTLPEFRGRGCQSALIRARVASAAAAGCDLVVSTAAFGATSHRNLERCGLRTAYTKPVLRLTPPA
jgi:GNAT superfamily N-acetyltransferase